MLQIKNYKRQPKLFGLVNSYVELTQTSFLVGVTPTFITLSVPGVELLLFQSLAKLVHLQVYVRNLSAKFSNGRNYTTPECIHLLLRLYTILQSNTKSLEDRKTVLKN